MEPILGIQGGAEKQVNSVKSYATEITQVLPSKARGAALLIRGISHQPWYEVWPLLSMNLLSAPRKLVSPTLALNYLSQAQRFPSSLEMGRRREVELQKNS